MKPTRQASVATSSNQCFLRRYTVQIRFGSAMSFDKRLIAARCIGRAWALGEAFIRRMSACGPAAVGAKRPFIRKTAFGPNPRQMVFRQTFEEDIVDSTG